MAQITQIQVRRDTAANWTSVNPTLSAGEIGFETDTGKFKIGTGSSTWTSLTYATDGSKLTGTIAASTATTATNVSGTVAVANGGTNKTTFGATAGVIKTNGSDVLSAATIVDADVASGAAIAPSKISGTAATLTQQRNKFYQGTTTLDVPSRLHWTSSTALASGSTRGWLFTPEQDITITKISNYVTTAAVYSTVNTGNPVAAGVSGASTIQFTNGTWSPTFTPVVGMTVSGTGVGTGAKITAYNSTTFTITVDVVNSGTVSGTITLTTTTPQAKAAIYTVSGTTLTPLVTSSWQSSPFPTATQFYDFTISSTTLTAGTTYAVGMLTTWTGSPVTTPLVAILPFVGAAMIGSTNLPQITWIRTSETDISGALTIANGSNTAVTFRLS